MAKCEHFKISRGYISDSDYADSQLKKGIRQKKCPVCKLWFWPTEYHSKKKLKRVFLWKFIEDKKLDRLAEVIREALEKHGEVYITVE